MDTIIYTLLAVQASLTVFTFVEAVKYYRAVKALRKLNSATADHVTETVNRVQNTL